jgi:hypothetical protein
MEPTVPDADPSEQPPTIDRREEFGAFRGSVERDVQTVAVGQDDRIQWRVAETSEEVLVEESQVDVESRRPEGHTV